MKRKDPFFLKELVVEPSNAIIFAKIFRSNVNSKSIPDFSIQFDSFL